MKKWQRKHRLVLYCMRKPKYGKEDFVASKKKCFIAYRLPNSNTVHKSSTINAGSIIEAKNIFKMGNPDRKIIICVKVLG